MSKKPLRTRVMVSVTPELYTLLERLSSLAGASMGGLCGELLQDAMPALEAMAKALELARDKNADAFEVLAKLLAEAQVKSGEVQLDMLEAKSSIRRARSDQESGNENGQD